LRFREELLNPIKPTATRVAVTLRLLGFGLEAEFGPPVFPPSPPYSCCELWPLALAGLGGGLRFKHQRPALVEQSG
jgi:hypothetical protein